MKSVWFASMLLLALPFAANAQNTVLHARTAQELAELCASNGKDPAGAARLNFCIGYAQATFDLETRRAGDKKPFCISSPSPSRAQTMAEFATWVKSSADKGGNPQEALMRFMGQRFPCKS